MNRTLINQIGALVLFWLMALPAARCSDSTDQNLPVKNVFRAAASLPANIKRVLILPLVADRKPAELAGGCETLNPVLQAELVKTKKFEVVPASADTLENLTGKLGWNGSEVLPADFFDSLNRFYGCDAVMFCQLTVFRAYAPLAIGWRLKLVDSKTHKIIWSADEVFDADDAQVAKDAQQFQKQQKPVDGKTKSVLKGFWKLLNDEPTSALDQQWSILNSPRLFGQFSANKLLQTLPAR